MSDEPTSVGGALEGLLRDLQSVESARKASIESRAISVITTSGALVTLLLGLVAVVTTKPSFTSSTTTLSLLALAALFFVSAAIIGILCNTPGNYLEIQASSLLGLTSQEAWPKDGMNARREIAEARLGLLDNWQTLNQKKARTLSFAIAAEATAVVLSAFGVMAILLQAI